MARELTLAQLSDEERDEHFDRLQARMRSIWEIMRHDEEAESVVVVPSVSLDHVGERSGLPTASPAPPTVRVRSFPAPTGMTRAWPNRDPRALPDPRSIPLMRMTARTQGSTAHRQRWRNYHSSRDSVGSHSNYDRVPGRIHR